jgi:acyl carrier protein
MHMTDIQNETKDFLVRNYLFGRSDQLNDNDPLLGKVIDSTGVLELIGFLQEHFAITVPDEEVIPENLDSVSNITAYVARKLANGNQP